MSTSVARRIENALWGLFIGDAMAMPVHWFYSTERIRECFPEGIDRYYPAPHPHPDAFMLGMSYQPDVERAKALNRPYDILHEHARFYRTSYSDFGFSLDSREGEHGNSTAALDQRMHYHHALEAGESTLGAGLVRVLMRSVIERDGYSQDGFLNDFPSQDKSGPVYRNLPPPLVRTLQPGCRSGKLRGAAARGVVDRQRWRDDPAVGTGVTERQ